MSASKEDKVARWAIAPPASAAADSAGGRLRVGAQAEGVTPSDEQDWREGRGESPSALDSSPLESEVNALSAELSAAALLQQSSELVRASRARPGTRERRQPGADEDAFAKGLEGLEGRADGAEPGHLEPGPLESGSAAPGSDKMEPGNSDRITELSLPSFQSFDPFSPVGHPDTIPAPLPDDDEATDE